MNLTIEEILKAVDGKLISGNNNIKISGVSTDSRTIKKGELFIPLIGENFNGENFLDDAIKLGSASLTAKSINTNKYEKPVILVEDTKIAFHRLANYYRSKFDIPFIAVTGSSGKTTTKDMIYSVLSKKYNVLKTEGNLNNEIGLPITLFKLNKTHQIAIVEMGMSDFGEIRKLKNIANPNIAVYTNIGVAHIEKLGSRENILKAKSELIEDFGNGNSIVINSDDDMLRKLLNSTNSEYITYGIKSGDFKAYNIRNIENGISYNINLNGEPTEINLSVPGEHNVYNSLAAICIGSKFGVNKEDIKEALKNFLPGKMRLNIINLNEIKLIDDSYNANPSSMKAAISVLKGFKNGRKIAVLGNMLELGEYSNTGHKDVGKFVKNSNIDILITVGDQAKMIANGAKETGMADDKIFICDDNTSAIKTLKKIIEKNDIILVKGSRGMGMEKIVKYLQESAF